MARLGPVDGPFHDRAAPNLTLSGYVGRNLD